MRALALPPLNPVLARELKQRMRGRLIWLVVTGYLAILALILRFVYLGASNTMSGTSFFDPLASASVGRSIFHWLLFFMLMLVCFIVPGLTASSISGERERQTLVSLQVTMLRPRSIVLGKLLSSLAFTALLIVASLPLVSVPFLVGGVSAAEVLKGVVMVLLTAVVLAALAVACSAVLRRTQAATVVAYGLTAALTVGTFIVYGGQRAMDGPVDKASPAVLALNPFVATADVVQGRSDVFSFDSPFTALADLIRPDSFGVPLPVDVRGGVGFGVDGGFGVGVGRVGPAQQAAVERGLAIANAPPLVIAPDAPPIGPATTAVGAPVPPAPDIAINSEIQIFANDLPFRLGQLEGEAVRPHAKVAGLRMWLAWLVASMVLGGLALLVAVRRVTLPAARDSS